MDDKVVAVTGGFGILGRAVVKELAEARARVVAIDIAETSTVDGAALELGGVDGSHPSEAEAAVAAILEKFGRLDALVNIAGGFRWETVADGAIETWDWLYQTNVRTAVVMSKAVTEHLPAHGAAIVIVGAAATARAAVGMGAYTAAKSGVARLTEALADEFKDRGIRVNAVLPSIIDTPANRSDMPKADFDRWVSPEALAKVVAFLISDDSAAITGALIPVTGGI
ncbi:MAG: putative oxidoreductase [Alphaproteobacteria bacterium]|nr:putative oxidoreductase [Alphaproteobacteria bacterium]